jgi:succinyl-diaminopimelate desuccinylase
MTDPRDVVELTRALVRHDTINPPGNERACAEFLGAILKEAGFSVAYHAFADERTSVVARLGGDGAKPPLCFTGHIDTVPLGTVPWKRDPLAADVADGKLHGRGSSDMKSGVAAFVAATVELAGQLANGPGVVLVITAGEETGCEGAEYLAGLEGALGTAGAIVVAEPTANYPFVGHKGSLWMTATTHGVTAHGSMPEHGDNAVYKAARAITKLEDFDFNVARHAVLGKPTLNVGTVHGGINVNSVPDRAEIGIDIRTIPGQDHAALHASMKSYLGDEVELTPSSDVEGVWTDPADPWVREVFAVLEPMLGEPLEPRAATYFTDGPALSVAYGGPPTVILGPGEPALAHQTDEFCYVDRIIQARDAYMGILRRWCGFA